MASWTKWSVTIFLGVFIVAQFKPAPRTNPEFDPSRSFWIKTRVSPEVAGILRRACADCHSFETRWPWYSRVAPVSWFVTDHVNHGRRHLNFSDWMTISPHGGKTPSQRLELICKEITSGAMPLRSYAWMHPEAALSREDIRTVCEWARGERLRTLAVAGPSPR